MNDARPVKKKPYTPPVVQTTEVGTPAELLACSAARPVDCTSQGFEGCCLPSGTKVSKCASLC
jgi:hypothetical protein